jgi:hypothetical protein
MGESKSWRAIPLPSSYNLFFGEVICVVVDSIGFSVEPDGG